MVFVARKEIYGASHPTSHEPGRRGVRLQAMGTALFSQGFPHASDLTLNTTRAKVNTVFTVFLRLPTVN